MITLLVLLGACNTPPQEATIEESPSGTAVAGVAPPSPPDTPTPLPTLGQETSSPAGEEGLANVIKVDALGSSGSYSFSVTVQSPDAGCARYADWWEVLTEEGELLYRRVLVHSHTSEQPFTRSGGPVRVEAAQEVVVRAHMSTSGYGGAAMRGSVAGGFNITALGPEFAPDAAEQGPLPESCAF